MTAPAFTAEQGLAIERREGSLLVAAAAGSGKTSVLVERFVRSVLDDGVAPDAILAITFTEKAAGELRARVRRRFAELGERVLAQEAEGAWVSTIHGFCARVLRANAVRAGLDPAFSVLDEATARELREAAFERALAVFLDRPEALELVAAYRPDRLRRMVLEAHDSLRGAGRPPRLPSRPPRLFPQAELEALRAACGPALTELAGAGATVAKARAKVESCLELLAGLGPGQGPAGAALAAVGFAQGRAADMQGPGVAGYLAARIALEQAIADWAARPTLALVDELLVGFAAAYAERKRERAALDYDDLELGARDLLAASPEVATRYAERFERVMVDEFQDTNRLQLELLSFLDRDNVFVVGDERQAIYGFRHATVEVFRERRQALATRAATASLQTNFRSRPELLEPINRTLGGEAPLLAGRDAAGGPRVELIVVDSQADWPQDDALSAGQSWRCAEARAVAARVAQLVDSGEHAAADVAVLLRAAGDMQTYERALEQAGLATLASGGRGFWARQQVLDLCAYLAALANPRDEKALLGTLASPLGAAASPDALALLALAARAAGRGLWDVLHEQPVEFWAAALPDEERARIARFIAGFADERRRAPRLGLDALLERAVERSRYDEHVLRLPGGERRLANVAKLIRLAAGFNGRQVRALVDRALGELEADAREPEAPIELAGLDAVRLMTVHAAKGLEFPVVVVADLGRQPNVQTPDLLVDGDRVGLRLVPMHGASRPTLDYATLAEERLEREAQEDRRVFHVAMTRAEERLILAGGVAVDAWPSARRGCPPLVWLGPALAPGLPQRLAAGERELEVDGVRVTVQRPVPPETLFELAPEAPVDDEQQASPVPLEHPPLPAVVAPAPVRSLSYSTLSRYAQCGYRFYLERVLSLPPQDPPPASGEEEGDAEPATAGLDPLLRGTLVHELLEHHDLAAADAPDAAAVRARAAMHELELSDDEVADVRELVAAALGSELLARVRAARSAHREQGFAVAFGDAHQAMPLLTGFVDVLAWERDGTALVVDYKTDRLAGTDPAAVVELEYGVQRRIYALAALRAGAQRVEVAHVYLERPDAPAVASYAAGDAGQLEAEVAERAAELLAGAYPVAAEPHRDLCATCPGRGGLCSWPEEVVLRPLPVVAAGDPPES